MIAFLQNLIISVFNPIYDKKVSRIANPVRHTIVFCIFFLFFVYFLILRSAAFYEIVMNRKIISQSIGSILFLIVALLSMEGPIKRVYWRKPLFSAYILFALGLIITGIVHPIGDGYMSFGVMLVLVYPSLYLVLNNTKRYETLFDIISAACILAGLVYFVWYVFLKLSEKDAGNAVRDAGGMFNANFLSFIGIGMVCSALYILYRCSRNRYIKKIHICTYCLAAIAAGMLFIIKGASRSALLIIGTNVLIVFYYWIKNAYLVDERFEGKRKLIGLVAATLIVVVVAVIIMNNDVSFLERFNFTNKSPDEYASGRVRLWQSYASRLNLLGHDMENVDWDELTAGITTMHAHNSFLEYSYRCGIIVGIIYLLFHCFASLIAVVLMLGKKRNRDYEVFMMLSLVHYTVHSLLDIATVPLGSYGPFFFYLSIAPLFVIDNGHRFRRREGHK